MYGFARVEATRKKVRLRWIRSAFKASRITMDIQIDLMIFFLLKKTADSVLWLKNRDSFAFLCIFEEEEEEEKIDKINVFNNHQASVCCFVFNGNEIVCSGANRVASSTCQNFHRHRRDDVAVYAYGFTIHRKVHRRMRHRDPWRIDKRKSFRKE